LEVNNSSIEVLQKLGFDLAETQEKFVLLSHKGFKKIKVPKVLNWDYTGYPEKNAVNITKDERCFNLLIKQSLRLSELPCIHEIHMMHYKNRSI
jgi:hypothetical protein